MTKACDKRMERASEEVLSLRGRRASLLLPSGELPYTVISGRLRHAGHCHVLETNSQQSANASRPVQCRGIGAVATFHLSWMMSQPGQQ
jgi:hypothetical protein